MNKKSVGNAGESIACAYLKKIGYKILERNFRYEGGEIDIIALDKGVTVFIEVKYRSNLEFGYPADAVTQSKQRKIINFLMKLKLKSKNKLNCKKTIDTTLPLW